MYYICMQCTKDGIQSNKTLRKNLLVVESVAEPEIFVSMKCNKFKFINEVVQGI